MRWQLPYLCTVLALSAAVLLLIGQYTDLDLRLADLFYDLPSHSFPWRDSWFAAVLLHQWFKYLLMGLGMAVIALCLLDAFHLVQINAQTRMRLRVVAASAIAVPLVISLLKHYSALHCPWDITLYGGSAPYLRLLDPIPQGWQAGQCFPAGHASSALWLAAFAVFWLPEKPARAWAVYCCGLGIGMFLGWVQQMRGAHFFTHTLWSAWIASAVILLLIRAYEIKVKAGIASTR